MTCALTSCETIFNCRELALREVPGSLRLLAALWSHLDDYWAESPPEQGTGLNSEICSGSREGMLTCCLCSGFVRVIP